MYDKDHKTWEIPVRYLDRMLEFFGDNNIHGYIDDLSEVDEPVDLGDILYKTSPFNHQKEGVEFGLTKDRWFLGDEQGLGKTKQAIDIAVNKKSEKNYSHCLIVCGVNSLKWNWQIEVTIHSNETAHILGQRVNKKGIVKIGSTKDKISDVVNIDNLPYFIITNIESFRDGDFADAIKFACQDGKINMCVADEFHKMKGPTASQTKGFLICQPEYRLAMTGTPIMNTPLDLYTMLKWLGYENHTFYSFKNHYCVMGGFGGYEIVGYKNMEQLTEVIQSIMLRRLKKDVLDLPEKIYVDEIVEMTPKQAQLYQEVRADIITNIDKIMLSPNPLASVIRLRQCTGYTGILSSSIQESAKLDRMEELIENAVSNGDKVIVFSNWTQVTDAVIPRLSQYNPALMTGAVSDEDRELQKKKFMEDESCKVIVGTIGAMGTGHTLTAASTVIFLDEPWNKALFDQCVDRAHRIGTTSNITIYSIMCKDTADIRIHDIVYKKGALSDCIIDGEIANNKTEIINYLIA
jgi:SNF2 family DNA or RNA helicase